MMAEALATGEIVVSLVPLALLCLFGFGLYLLNVYWRASGELSPALVLGAGVWLVAVELCLLVTATAMTAGAPPA